MAKIDENLVKDEEVLIRAEMSPVCLVVPCLIMVLGLIIGLASGGFLVGLILAVVLGLIFGSFRAILSFLTNELAITNKRVYGRCKPKLFSSEELDMPIDKISSLGADQGLIGGIFGYNSITIKAYGDGWKFPFIKNAKEVKNTFYENQK